MRRMRALLLTDVQQKDNHMPKHEKDMLIPVSRHEDLSRAWIRLNPEYANEDKLVEREIAAYETEMEAARAECNSDLEPHGFNGHDPHVYRETNGYDMDSYSDDFELYDRYSEEDAEEPDHSDPVSQILFEEALREDEERRTYHSLGRRAAESIEYLEKIYCLPHIQSHRMGVRCSIKGEAPRWTHRRYEGYRAKRSNSGNGVHNDAPYAKSINAQKRRKWLRNKPPSKRPFVKDWFKGA